MNLMLKNLRNELKERNITSYVIFNTDPHGSEYIPKDCMFVKALTGFTGDNATVVVTQDFAGLWTDSRFFLSGEKELENSGFTLMRRTESPETSYVSFLKKTLTDGQSVAFDGELLCANRCAELRRRLFGLTVNNSTDLSTVWTDKPEISLSEIFILDEKFSGESAEKKLARVRESMTEKGADTFLTSALDETAWILNLRASDIDYCPVFRSHLIISTDGKAVLFVHKKRLSEKIKKYLAGLNVDTEEYNGIYNYVSHLQKRRVMTDGNVTNSKLYNAFDSSCRMMDCASPVQLMKAQKNKTELENFRTAMIEDGLAMERFLYRFEKNLENGVAMTELSAAQMLLEERKKSENFLSESFECISAFNAHAAMPHFAPSEKDNLEIEKDGVYLVDSGGQYLTGTTDITRTLPTGKFSNEFARDYTLVLSGNLSIAMQKFPTGTAGGRLDVLARQALWQYGLDFGHGTGHGVGFCLNCHEGPQGFSSSGKKNNQTAFVEGMIITDEPGFYKENCYGIRHENMLQVVESKDFDNFLEFSVMTLCHIDTRAVRKEFLSQRQIDFLNAYNRKVYEILSPSLNVDERNYLRKKTAEI